MTHPEEHSFDQAYWDEHWQPEGNGAVAPPQVHPYLAEELDELTPGTALDAGCGAGAEAIWLAQHGWQVTGADPAAWELHSAREAHRTVPRPDGERRLDDVIVRLSRRA